MGATFGSVNAADIAFEVKHFFTTVRKTEGFTLCRMARAGTTYLRSVNRLTPHWIQEAEALANAAGADAERYLIYQGANYRGINRPECFSYYSSPRWNAGRVTLLHKNRDNVARPQCACIKGTRVAGRRLYRFMADGDTSDMGTMMGLNERGAVVADTGACDPHPRQVGMMNTDLMRLVLEGAADIEEARELLYEAVFTFLCAPPAILFPYL